MSFEQEIAKRIGADVGRLLDRLKELDEENKSLKSERGTLLSNFDTLE
jgi:hypothetical protein